MATQQEIDQINDQIKQLRKELGYTASIKLFRPEELKEAKLQLRGLVDESRELGGNLDYVARSFKDAVNEMSKQNIYLNSAKKSLTSISDISRKIVDYRRGESSYSEKQLEDLQKKARIQFDELRLVKERGNLQGNNLLEVQNALLKEELFNEELRKTIKYTKEVNKEIGLFGSGIEGAGKFLAKLGFEGLSKPLSEAIQKTKDARLQLKLNKDVISDIENEISSLNTRNLSNAQIRAGFGGKELQNLLAQKETLQDLNKELDKETNKYKNIALAIKEQVTLTNLTDALIAKTVDSFFKLNEAQTDFRRLTGNSITLQSQLNTQLITSVDYIKTAVALTEKLNFNAQSIFPSDTLATAAEMVTSMGATQEQANQAAIFSKIYGKNLNDVNASIVKGTNSFNATNKSALNVNGVLKNVYSTSTEIAVSLGKNPDRLAEAVRQANNLGLSLEQVDKIADSLLNVEQSIAAEFEAEVITGKQLNLEAARYYALTNQTDKLGKEIAKNQNVISSFATDNRLEQEAIAKTLGLSRKELADMYVQDQLRQGLTAEQIAQNTNLELSDIKRLTIQDSINKSIEKMTQLLAGPLEMFASLIDSAGIFYGIMGAIGTIITVQLVRNMVLFGVALGKDIARLGVKLGLVSAIAAAEISGAMAATLGLGAVAIIAGIAAGIGAMKSAQSTATSNTVPGLAEGGTVTSGGTVMVGEKGPEMLSLKPGATVTPLTKLNAATVTQQAPQPTAIIDYEKLAQSMSRVKLDLNGYNIAQGVQTPLGMTTRRGIG